jgi:hypothetical protein
MIRCSRIPSTSLCQLFSRKLSYERRYELFSVNRLMIADRSVRAIVRGNQMSIYDNARRVCDLVGLCQPGWRENLCGMLSGYNYSF